MAEQYVGDVEAVMRTRDARQRRDPVAVTERGDREPTVEGAERVGDQVDLVCARLRECVVDLCGEHRAANLWWCERRQVCNEHLVARCAHVLDEALRESQL